MRVRLAIAGLTISALALLPGSASAVTGGQYDANNHPYVGYVSNGVEACSGTLLSSTVMLTAAHCFSTTPSTLGNNSVTGGELVAVSFDPNLAVEPSSARQWHIGTYYFDPQFGPTGNGHSSADSHDVAVVVFTSTGCFVGPGAPPTGTCGPIASPSTYGALPPAGLTDTLKKAGVDIVGFGAQGIVHGGGQPQPGTSGTRFITTTSIVPSNDKLSSEFLKLHNGACFGDSGGPDLLGGTNIVLAENSFLDNSNCAGVTYSYRVDTPQALSWITTTATAYGGQL